jgi:single stranded DNA-binding protein
MARDINRVLISGRVVGDIDLRECPDGKPVADFKLVSNRKQLPKDDPERLKSAVFIKVTLWTEDAMYWSGQRQIETLGRGDEVIVEGQLFSDDFTPRDSEQRTSGRIRIDNASIKLVKRSRRTDEDLEDEE